MTLTLTIPTLETDRLTLRAPRQSDFARFMDFMESDRSEFVGGPIDRRNAMRSFGHVAGLWVTRGYSLFIGELKSAPGLPIGAFGPWHPEIWPELEFGWSLWNGKHEGQGYVTEAMRATIPWAWGQTGADTAVSYIEESNARSIQVAKALGASFDQGATDTLNAPGSLFHNPGNEPVLVYRHHPREARA